MKQERSSDVRNLGQRTKSVVEREPERELTFIEVPQGESNEETKRHTRDDLWIWVDHLTEHNNGKRVSPELKDKWYRHEELKERQLTLPLGCKNNQATQRDDPKDQVDIWHNCGDYVWLGENPKSCFGKDVE